MVTHQLFIIDQEKKEKIRFCFENIQMALSKQPSVQLTFFLNLDMCQESNLNNLDVNTSSDCSRLTSGALYKIRYVIGIKNFLNPKEHQNCIRGSKVTAILLKGWILPIGGVALGRVCACSLRSRLVQRNIEHFWQHVLFLESTVLYSAIAKTGVICFLRRVERFSGVEHCGLWIMICCKWRLQRFLSSLKNKQGALSFLLYVHLKPNYLNISAYSPVFKLSSN